MGVEFERLRCRVRGVNRVEYPEQGDWTESTEVEIGPDAAWRPPPLVTLTFKDALNGEFWAAVLDANTRRVTQLFRRRRATLMEMADGRSSSVVKEDKLQAKFIALLPLHSHSLTDKAEAQVEAMAATGVRALNTSVFNTTTDSRLRLQEEVQLPFTLRDMEAEEEESVSEHMPTKGLLSEQKRYHPRMVNDARFRSHAFTSDWLNGHSFVAVPGTSNNSIVAMWEYTAHRLLETRPGQRIESLVFNAYGNELFALLCLPDGRHSVHRISLFDWRPPGLAHLQPLLNRYPDSPVCNCAAVEAQDVRAIALDLRGMLRSGGVLPGTRPALVMATAEGHLFSANLSQLAAGQSGLCNCDHLLQLSPRPSHPPPQPLPSLDSLGPISTIAVSTEYLFYSYVRGPLFMTQLHKLKGQPRRTDVFPVLQFFNGEQASPTSKAHKVQLTPSEIFDIELNSRAWKPYPINSSCLVIPRMQPVAVVRNVAPDTVEIGVDFPLEQGNGAECRMFPPPAVYGHVLYRNLDQLGLAETDSAVLEARKPELEGGWAKLEEFSSWRSIVIHNLNSSTSYQLYVQLLNGEERSMVSKSLFFRTGMSRLLYLVVLGIVSLFALVLALGLVGVAWQVAKRVAGRRRKESWLRWLETAFVETSADSTGDGGIARLPVFPAKDITDTGQRLGEGAFGICSVALLKLPDSSQPTRVAMKELNKHKREGAPPETEEMAERVEYAFFCEADAMQRLQSPDSCPNLLRLIGISVDRQTPCLLMELMKTDVKSLLTALSAGQSRYSLSEEDAVRLAIDVAAGMAFMHARSFVHRDIRAVNVFLTSTNPLDWVAKLGDLGLSRDLRKLQQTKREYPVRSDDLVPCAWGAPETLARPNPVYGFPSDVWSFGVFCWELATLGGRPYGSKRPAKIIEEVVERQGNPGRPARLPKLYERAMAPCWCPDQNDRPSAVQLLDHLADVLAEAPVPAEQGPFNLALQETDKGVWVQNSSSNANHTDSTCLTETTLDSLGRSSSAYKHSNSAYKPAAVSARWDSTSNSVDLALPLTLPLNGGVYLDQPDIELPLPAPALPSPQLQPKPLNGYLPQVDIEDYPSGPPPPKVPPYSGLSRFGRSGSSGRLAEAHTPLISPSSYAHAQGLADAEAALEALLRQSQPAVCLQSESNPYIHRVGTKHPTHVDFARLDSGYVGGSSSSPPASESPPAKSTTEVDPQIAQPASDSEGTLTDEGDSYFQAFFKKKSRSLRDLGLHSDYIDG